VRGKKKGENPFIALAASRVGLIRRRGRKKGKWRYSAPADSFTSGGKKKGELLTSKKGKGSTLLIWEAQGCIVSTEKREKKKGTVRLLF